MTWSRKRREDRTCSASGCPDAFYAHELCKRHYYRKKRHGDPEVFVQAHGRDRYRAGKRWCSRHKDWLPLSRFSGKKTWCRPCRRFSRYGLLPAQYELLLKKYGGKCRICRTRKAEVVDHDHSCCPGRHTCGKCIRGMICRQCNVALGILTDEGVRRAMFYLNGKAI